MKAIVLAAGYATRLYPLTKEFPKPLLLVRERPIIDYTIDKLHALKGDIEEIIVVTNSKFIGQFLKWRGNHPSRGMIKVVDDLTASIQDKRGAVGDIKFVVDKYRLREDILVIGGDNLFDDDLKNFLAFARGKKSYPSIGVFDINNKEQACHYGVVKLNRSRRVIDFKEKPRSPQSSLVAMCVYYFPGESLALIKEYVSLKAQAVSGSSGAALPKNKNDATGFYIDWLRRRSRVYGYVFSGRWYDIGDHHFYKEAKEAFVPK